MSGEEKAEPLGLPVFLKRSQGRALAEWEEWVRKLAPAERLDVAALRDNIPVLLDRIIDAAEGRPVTAADTVPDEHARVRLDQGFSLEQIAEEYRILRAALFHLLEEESAELDPKAIMLLNNAIGHAVARALSSYHRQRSRTLAALERISHEAFASHHENLSDFLRRLLGIVIESTEATDTAVIYLREWDRLVVRAAAGVEGPLEDQFGLRMGRASPGPWPQRRHRTSRARRQRIPT